MFTINGKTGLSINNRNVLKALLLSAVALPALAAPSAVDQHQLGTKYSPLKQIDKSNVAKLELAWKHSGGDLPEDLTGLFISLQDQPTLIEGKLVVCTASRQIIALDPKTGEERWKFDPKGEQFNMRKCRGVANWSDKEAAEGASCKTRIVYGTADNRLIALDANTGKPCEDFGDKGEVHVPPSKPMTMPGEVMITSRPAIVNDTVVVGSAVMDNQRVDAPSGRVMAYHARTGEFLWEFDPLPRNPDDPAMATWGKGTDFHGGANVWTTMSADQERDLVFLPTSAPSGDFYGGDRPGDNRYSTSIVAIRGATGEVVWDFQFVRHDVFDFDLPAPPLLIDLPHNGEIVPALVQNTKMGLIFIFNRETGEPLTPIVDRPVPQQGAVKGEVLSPTQPFPGGMPTIGKQGFSPDDAWGFTPVDRWLCRRKVAELNYGPLYTPPSEKGTIFYPAAGGGPNWGGGSYDPDSNIMVVPSNRVPMVVTLLPREGIEFAEGETMLETRGTMMFPNKGAPYVPKISPLMSPLGAPCSAPPWAALTAIDLAKREIVWEVPLGGLGNLLPFSISWEPGMPGAGGALVTAGGLVFIGYSIDNMFRAFDLHTGEVLWKAELPAAGTSVPVTYEVDGEQYIVIPAGGHSMYGSSMGDYTVAYRLKQ